MLDQFTNTFGMQFFMPFIAFSILAYLSFPAIKRKVGKSYLMIFLVFFVIVIYIVAVLSVSAIANENVALLMQLIVFFLIPFSIYLYIKLFSRHKDIFASEGKGAASILGILVVVSFIPYILYAETTGHIAPEVRIIVASLYMMVPLAVIGIRKVVELIISRFFVIGSKSYQKKNEFVVASMIGILAVFSYVQLSTGILAVNALSGRFSESEGQKVLHEWIRENIPADAKIASDMPHAVLLRTGHETVNFHQAYKDNVSYERWIIKKFDIDYICTLL